MITAVGLLVVVISVVGGFLIAGGKLLALFHISEIMVVGGTALGTVLISTPGPTLKSLGAQLPSVMKPTPFSRTLYLDALKLLYELFQMAQRDGLVAIESHIEAPSKSVLFKKYPNVLRHHEAVTFLSDSLRLVLLGTVSPHDLDMMMESEIEVHHEQESMKVKALQRAADALPGIGIVAAVLGIVVTMGAINGPIERIGEHVAAALTGTFLGVLLAYGFVNPLANGLENLQTAEVRFFHFIKASVVAVAKGSSPLVAVEFARRSIFLEARPSFTEMETACKGLKAKAGTTGEQQLANAA
jgi:chemotaxis protein MotA